MPPMPTFGKIPGPPLMKEPGAPDERSPGFEKSPPVRSPKVSAAFPGNSHLSWSPSGIASDSSAGPNQLRQWVNNAVENAIVEERRKASRAEQEVAEARAEVEKLKRDLLEGAWRKQEAPPLREEPVQDPMVHQLKSSVEAMGLQMQELTSEIKLQREKNEKPE